MDYGLTMLNVVGVQVPQFVPVEAAIVALVELTEVIE